MVTITEALMAALQATVERVLATCTPVVKPLADSEFSAEGSPVCECGQLTVAVVEYIDPDGVPMSWRVACTDHARTDIELSVEFI